MVRNTALALAAVGVSAQDGASIGSIFDETWTIVSLAFLGLLLFVLAARACGQLCSLDCRREVVQEVVVQPKA